MIARDKNHPCVVMWSIANEPGLDGDGERPQQAYDYFRPLYELAHASDPQNRPVTLVCCQNDYTTDIPAREAFSGVIPPILGGFTPLRP